MINLKTYKAGWLTTFCFLLIACSTPRQKMLHQKWHLSAVAVSQPIEGSLMESDSGQAKIMSDTIKNSGADFIDFSNNKNYNAQLMSTSTTGTYQFDEAAGQIIRHNETTNITDTVEVKKLSADTLILFEKENNLTMFLTAVKNTAN